MPNTLEKWEITAQFQNPERAAFWRNAIGTDTVPIVSPVPALPGVGVQLCLMLDLGAITAHLKAQIIAAIAQNFHLTKEEAAHAADSIGIPIVAEGMTIVCTDRRLITHLAPEGGH